MSVDAIMKYLEINRDLHVEQLCDWLRIPSISSISDHDGDVRKAAEMVAGELEELLTLLNKRMPNANIIGLGEALIKYSAIAQKLRPDDLYVIDSRTYHANFDRLVVMYDKLRNDTGCMMNLDLHRVATSTGTSRAVCSTVVDPVAQASWILQGRPAKRVIVERLEDIEPFKQATSVPVVFVAEVC